MINNLMASLVTVGGMGFMNFVVTDQLGVIDVRHDQKTEIIAYSLLWSIFDYALYLAVTAVLRHFKIYGSWSIALALMITLIMAFTITCCVANRLCTTVYWIYNKVSGKAGFADLNPGTVFIDKLNNNKRTQAYIYNFGHEPIEFGVVDKFGLSDSGKPEISLIPSNEGVQPSYENLKSFLSKDENHKIYNPSTYVDYDLKIIMILMDN